MADDPSDELFAVDPNEFVATRDGLAKELRAAGDKEQAALVKARRKPSIPSWALNALSRDDPKTVDEFAAAANAARAAQHDAIAGGDGEQLRDALGRLRRASTTVAKRVRDIIAVSGRSVATYEREIDTALNEIATSPPLLDALRSSRLTWPVPAGEPAPDATHAGLATSAKRSAPREPAKLTRARADVERRRADAAAAIDAAEQALAEVERAEAALADARRSLDEARQRQRDATSEADDARAGLRQAERTLNRLIAAAEPP